MPRIVDNVIDRVRHKKTNIVPVSSETEAELLVALSADRRESGKELQAKAEKIKELVGNENGTVVPDQ